MHFFTLRHPITKRKVNILIYQPNKRLYGLVTFACRRRRPRRAIFYCDLETLQYLNNKDTSLKNLILYPTIKKIFLKYNITPVCRVPLLWSDSSLLGG